MRITYSAFIASFFVFSSIAHAEAMPVPATIQASGMGSTCEQAIDNARASVAQTGVTPSENEIATTEFATFSAATSWCASLALGAGDPTMPPEGAWQPVGAYILPVDGEDARCSRDDSNHYYSQQKGYIVCPAPEI